jgi:hypothetical protein
VGTRHLNLLKSDYGGGRFNMGYANLMFKMTASGDITADEQFPVKPLIAQLLKILPT